MLLFFEKIFEGYIAGTSNVYTHTALGELLGSAESLSIYGQASSATGTSPTLTIQLEQSFDGTRWANQRTTAELSMVLASGSDQVIGAFPSSFLPLVPALSFVRLRMTLGGTAPATFLRLYASGHT